MYSFICRISGNRYVRWKIQTGSKIVKIFGEEIAVKAEIEYLDAFSGHADRDGLLEFIDKMKNKPHNIFINHGEIVSQQVLKTYITENLIYL